MKKISNNPKIAIYYDWLNQWGGAEKVLLNLLSIYPQSELFTLFHDPKTSKWLPKNVKIHTSFLQNWPRTNLLSPIYDLAAESLNFSNFDIVISTTSNVGHCLLTPPGSLFVVYYHNINRHLYLNPPTLLKPLLHWYKKIDNIYSKRPNSYLCNSVTTKNRLNKFLNITSTIINPGIDTTFFIPSNNPTNDYFLTVCRLVPHKNIDYVIDTFAKLNKKLVIVGTGRDEVRLKKLATKSDNILFMGQVRDKELLRLYQNCKALICPQVEDFGLTSIEAQSCGIPVITFQKGGVTETVINNQTGLFFTQQNEDSLANIVNVFDNTKFSSTTIRRHALNFDQSKFMLNFKKEISTLWRQHQNNYL